MKNGRFFACFPSTADAYQLRPSSLRDDARKLMNNESPQILHNPTLPPALVAIMKMQYKFRRHETAISTVTQLRARERIQK